MLININKQTVTFDELYLSTYEHTLALIQRWDKIPDNVHVEDIAHTGYARLIGFLLEDPDFLANTTMDEIPRIIRNKSKVTSHIAKAKRELELDAPIYGDDFSLADTLLTETHMTDYERKDLEIDLTAAVQNLVDEWGDDTASLLAYYYKFTSVQKKDVITLFHNIGKNPISKKIKSVQLQLSKIMYPYNYLAQA